MISGTNTPRTIMPETVSKMVATFISFHLDNQVASRRILRLEMF